MPNTGNVAGCTSRLQPESKTLGLLDAAARAFAEEHPEELAAYWEDHAGSSTANPFLAEAERAFWRVLG